MGPFMRRVVVTLTGGFSGGVILTILIHLLLQLSGVGNGQYVFVFFLLIPLSVAVGVLASLFLSPPRTGLSSQLSGILVGGLLALGLTTLVLWLIVLVGVHVLGW
jgi:hypothetical protein